MYIETIPRQLGGLGRHLMDTGRGSNERVIVRSDLSRDVPSDVPLALRLLAAPARRIRRMKNDVVHVVFSPERMLSADELTHILRTFEAEYKIPETNARLVVEHQKGERAWHYHVVYSMAAEGTGKALRFPRSGDRDEMLARRFEIELGQPLLPSTRVERTAELLRKRGLRDLADIAAQGPVAEKGRRLSKAETRENDRRGVDQRLLDERVRQAWRQADGDIARLPQELGSMGFHLAAGDKRIAGVPTVQLVDIETLKPASLTRQLNRLALHGDGPRFREVAIGAILGDLPPLAEVKAKLQKDAPQRSAATLLAEFDHLIAEMEFDGEHEEAVKARRGRAQQAARLSAEEKLDLRTRQRRVREDYNRRDRIRRARVNRAFLAAKLFGGRDLRKAAFYLVAVGLLASGAGLVTALGAAGFAVAAIPTYVTAKRLRVAADQAAIADRADMADQLRQETQRFFRERAVARRLAEQRESLRRARQRAEQARQQRAAQAELLRRQQHLRRLRQLAQQEAHARLRAVQSRPGPALPGQDGVGASQAPRRPTPVRQRPRGRDIER